MDRERFQRVTSILEEVRRRLPDRDPIRGMENLNAALAKFPTNAEFVAKLDERMWR